MDAHLLGKIIPFIFILVICLVLFIGGIWGLFYQLNNLDQKNSTYGTLLEVDCYSQDMAFYNTNPILMEITWNITQQTNILVKSNYTQIVLPYFAQHCWLSQCLWNNTRPECSIDFNGFNPYYVYLNQTYNPENYQSDHGTIIGLFSIGTICAFILIIMSVFFIVQKIRANKNFSKITGSGIDMEN
jgi:hypothetical protein